MGRLFDSLIAWLMRPRMRVLRRWSFVITVPVALVVAHFYGVQQGALVIAIRAALALAVAVAAWRVGGERGEALRDLLMHPRGRAFARAEFDVVTAVPRATAARATGRDRSAGVNYHRGTFGLALALAFTPVALSETSVTARTQQLLDQGGLAEREDAVLLPARGRVDVRLELAEPVRVQRPLNEPLVTRRLAVASDDPDALMSLLLAPRRAARGCPPAASACSGGST